MLSSEPGTRIEVTDDETPSTWVVLDGPPSASRSKLLRDQVASLAGREIASALESQPMGQALAWLWPRAAEETRGGAWIRPRQTASFLLVSPAVDGVIDLDTAELEAVWLDGREVQSRR